MTNRRAKAMATATVLGLGALGGVALGSNPGMPSATQQLAAGESAGGVVTSASGTTAAPSTQTVANLGGVKRAPIVTRSSGGAIPTSDD